MRRRRLLAAALLGTVGCYTTSDRIRTPRYESPTTGYDFCESLSKTADDVSYKWSATGWILSVTGSVMTVTGTVIGRNPNATNVLEREGGLLVSGVGLLLLPPAYFLFSRSDAASRAASDANDAMALESDRDAYKRCVAAKSAWLNSLIASNALGRENINGSSAAPTDELSTRLQKLRNDAGAAGNRATAIIAAAEVSLRVDGGVVVNPVQAAADLAKAKVELDLATRLVEQAESVSTIELNQATQLLQKAEAQKVEESRLLLESIEADFQRLKLQLPDAGS